MRSESQEVRLRLRLDVPGSEALLVHLTLSSLDTVLMHK